MSAEDNARLRRVREKKNEFLRFYSENFNEYDALARAGITRRKLSDWKSKDLKFVEDFKALEYKRYDQAWRILNEMAGITPRTSNVPLGGKDNRDQIKALLAIVRTDPRYQSGGLILSDNEGVPVKIEIKGLDSKKLDAVFESKPEEPEAVPASITPVSTAPPEVRNAVPQGAQPTLTPRIVALVKSLENPNADAAVLPNSETGNA